MNEIEAIQNFAKKLVLENYTSLEIDEEDEMFTGYVYYSCGNCGCFFGHRDDVPNDKVCKKCGKIMLLKDCNPYKDLTKLKGDK